MKRILTSTIIGYLFASYIAGAAWRALGLWSFRWTHWPLPIVFSPWLVPRDLVSTPVAFGRGVEWAAVVMWVTLFVPMVLTAAITYRVLRPGRGPGFCLTCGYSLRGNVSGICPECGTRSGIGAGQTDPS